MSQHAWIARSLSVPRFQPYLQECSGSVKTALQLYWWNVEVSASLYVALHCLEIGLRKALHTELSQRFGRTDWWSVCPLPGTGPTLVAEAVRSARQASVRVPGSDDVVAALSFGFWVSLLSRSND